MTNSRLLFVTGLTAIVGMYTLGIQRADYCYQSRAIAKAAEVQAKQIAQAGVELGLTRVKTLGMQAMTVDGLAAMGGSVSYTVTPDAGSGMATIVSDASYNGSSVRVSAGVIESSPGVWVLKVERWQDIQN